MGWYNPVLTPSPVEHEMYFRHPVHLSAITARVTKSEMSGREQEILLRPCETGIKLIILRKKETENE